MNRAIEKLVRTLERLHALYLELLECSQEKSDYLVDCDVESIEAAQNHEEMVVNKIVKLEGLRDESMVEAAEALACDMRPITLTALVLAMGPEEEGREELTGLRDALVETSRELSAANRLNEELCRQSLMHLDVYMGLLTGRVGRQSTYDARGRTTPHSARALVQRDA